MFKVNPWRGSKSGSVQSALEAIWDSNASRWLDPDVPWCSEYMCKRKVDEESPNPSKCIQCLDREMWLETGCWFGQKGCDHVDNCELPDPNTGMTRLSLIMLRASA